MVDKNLQTEDTCRKAPKTKPRTQKLKKLPMEIVSPVFKYRCDFRKATRTNETSSKVKLPDVIERYYWCRVSGRCSKGSFFLGLRTFFSAGLWRKSPRKFKYPQSFKVFINQNFNDFRLIMSSLLVIYTALFNIFLQSYQFLLIKAVSRFVDKTDL